MVYVVILLLIFSVFFTRFFLIPKFANVGPNNRLPKIITKKDWLLCGSITLFYAALSFYHLGSFQQDPVWYGDGAGKQINIIFDKPTVISKIGLYGCAINHNITQLSLVDEKGTIIPVHEINNSKTTSICGDQIFATNNNNKMLGYKIKVIEPKVIINKIYIFDQKESFITNYTYNYNYDSKLDNSEGIFHASELFITNNVTHNMIFDERYYALNSYAYTVGKFDINTAHPQLSELLIALGIKTFGMNPFGWRIIPNIFGILLLPLMYLFALRIFYNRFIAFFAMFFVATDFMHFTISRLAVIEPIVVFFNVLTYYYLWQYYIQRTINYRRSLLSLLYCSIALGLAAASKWSGLFAVPVILGIVLLSERKTYFTKYYQVFFILLSMLFISFLLYIASYIPLILISNTKLIPSVVSLQKLILNTHIHYTLIVDNMRITSKWWQWPLMLSTIQLFSYSNLIIHKSVSLCLMGNPLLWWSSIPVVCYACIKYIVKRDSRVLFLLLIFIIQYIPYIISARIMYVYYYYNIVLFEFILLAEMLHTIMSLKSRFYKILVSLFVFFVIIFFTAYYPVYAAKLISRSYIYNYLQLNQAWSFLINY